MGIGSRLTKLIEANGTNPNELAKKVGVSAQTIFDLYFRYGNYFIILLTIYFSNIFSKKY